LDFHADLWMRCLEIARRNLVFVIEETDILRRAISPNLPPGAKRLHLSSGSDGAIRIRFL